MPRVARLPEWDRVHSDEAGPRAANVHPLKYYAFLSYSHADEATADWLHGALERFRTPRALAGRLTDNGVIPRRLTPDFPRPARAAGVAAISRRGSATRSIRRAS